MKKKLLLSENDRDIAVALKKGEKTNINHSGCPAGEDRKKRLYIERKENGNVLCYCHHCSQSCVIWDSVSKNRSFTKGYRASGSVSTVGKPNNECSLPKDSEAVVASWPPQARVWLGKYGITNAEIATHSILYSERMGRVLLPCWNDGKLVSYQARKLFPEDTGPKYLSYGDKNSVYAVRATSAGEEHSDEPTITPLVIVEDVLSAIKVGRYADALALRKSSMSDKELQWVLNQGYEEFVVFLDDDNAQVKKSQIVIKNKLEAFGSVRIIHSNGRDPKEHSDLELEEILHEP